MVPTAEVTHHARRRGKVFTADVAATEPQRNSRRRRRNFHSRLFLECGGPCVEQSLLVLLLFRLLLLLLLLLLLFVAFLLLDAQLAREEGLRDVRWLRHAPCEHFHALLPPDHSCGAGGNSSTSTSTSINRRR